MDTVPLPIDPLLPKIRESLEKHPCALVVAEPGAGKTTRVPPSLLSAPFLGDREIWVLQPRRLAAKLAALRVAEELGETIGGRVGYQFRFENKTGPQTRLRFLTDGMLIPLAQGDPTLSKVGAVVLDEFHERSLALELGLAYLRRLQSGPRPDLKLLIMSATLDSDALSRYLSDCPILQSPGRVFPVHIDYFPVPEQPDLGLKVRSALRHLSSKGIRGTTLVFLPGLSEIRRCQKALDGGDWEVHPLYGDLPVEEQQRVLKPVPGNKAILSTNIAETSLTVPGVTAVVDSGLTRQSRVSAWSGLSSLVTVPASQASAAQRAGRSGRLQEGWCLRLYTKFDFDHRAAFDVPEILRSDLSKSLLDLAGLGVKDLETFPWLLKPAPPALETARNVLDRMGALTPAGALTETGRRMARFPLHPRLAKFLLEAEARSASHTGLLRQACRLAALISEERADSDDLLENLRKYDPDFDSKRLAEQLEGLLSEKHPHFHPSKEMAEKVLPIALLSAFPDRVAKVRVSEGSEARNRTGRARELLLSGGGTALAADSALTRENEYFVVVDAQQTPQGVKARSIVPIEEDWLLDLFSGDLAEEQSLQWNGKVKKVEGFKRLMYGQLVLDEKPLTAQDLGAEAQEMLFKEALAAGPAAYCDPEELDGFLGRMRFLAERSKGFPLFDREAVERALREFCRGLGSFNDLKEAGFIPALKARLSPKDSALLERLAPAQVTLAGGRKVAVHYEEGKPPWIESRLQDFFGMTRGPSVAEGAVPLTLHLLSPAKRPVQVTSDLSGFWERHYPQVRKELMRRYPRHKWPENPI